MNDMSKKVVLHITHTDIRTDSRILKELNSLSETGLYDMHGIGVSATDEAPASKQNENVSIETLNLISSGSKWRPRILRHLFTLIELIFKMTLKSKRLSPDVVHCHDTLVLPIGFLLKKLTGCKLIYDAHELESNKNGQSIILSKATLVVEKICWASVDLLVSVSPSILDWYNENLGVKLNSLVLNSPVLNDACDKEFKLDVKYFHEKYSIPNDTLVFIYLGILGSGRGIDYILEAFSSYKIKSHVVFMGFGDFEDKILNYSSSNTNIHLHPAVKHDEVVSYTRNADVGLCLIENISLSDYYCLPNKLFEYAFSKLPILASNFPDLNTYVKKYSLGVLSELEVAEVASAILRLEIDGVSEVGTVDLVDLEWATQANRLKNVYSTLIG
jgi:glycosyltransferase involved in cell wall biosynthesis